MVRDFIRSFRILKFDLIILEFLRQAAANPSGQVIEALHQLGFADSALGDDIGRRCRGS